MHSIADIKDLSTFIQSIEGLNRLELKQVRWSLDDNLAGIRATIHSQEVDGVEPSTSLKNAERYTVKKLYLVEQMQARLNSQSEPKARAYYLAWRNGWLATHWGVADWLIHDLSVNDEAETTEVVRLTEEQWNALPDTIERHQP